MSKDEGLTKKQKEISELLLKAAELAKEGLVDNVVKTLQVGMSAGKVSPAIGLASLYLMMDILHGGAYTIPVDALPYYMEEPERSPYYAPVVLPPLAKEAQKEVMMNSKAPHLFPKVISDQCYFILKEWMEIWFGIEGFAKIVTPLETLVEAPFETVTGIRKAEASETIALIKSLAAKK